MRSSAFREISFHLQVSPIQNNFRDRFCFPRWISLSEVDFAFQISLLAIMTIIGIMGIIDHNGRNEFIPSTVKEGHMKKKSLCVRVCVCVFVCMGSKQHRF